MSKLQEYYRLFDMFKGKLNEDQKRILEGLEDQLITEEILPAISESVAPVLGNLRRNLTLVVDYDPEGGITVKTTRGEVVVKEHTAKKYEIPSTNKTIKVAEAEPEQTEEPKAPIKRSPAKGLCIYLPNGTFVQEKKANITMQTALKQVDVVKLYELQIPHDGEFLVSKKEHPQYRGEQHLLRDGYLLNTHSSTLTKQKQLQKISDLLKLNWKVEVIK